MQERQDEWRPVALLLGDWITDAREAVEGEEAVRNLKAAEKWMTDIQGDIREERFGPIADQVKAHWEILRTQSSVSLDAVSLEGSATRRRVELEVTVDGVEGAALGVMSQGELHSLALSLFLPRATLPSSPFRFLVIDDPVQSMDPSRVDGLALLLTDTAEHRQVIVFTHDDRLPESVRRLGLDTTVVEVHRRLRSAVEVRPGLHPVERHLEDARALVLSEDLPETVMRRVVPGLCRHSLEAACLETTRRRRISAGERHLAIEQLWSDHTRLMPRLALALFDDPSRGGDVLTHVNNKFGHRAGDVVVACNKGVHEGGAANLDDLVRDADRLAHELLELR